MAEDDLAGWQFEIEEISPGVYNGRGWDGEGRSVEIRSAWAREIKDDRPTREAAELG